VTARLGRNDQVGGFEAGREAARRCFNSDASFRVVTKIKHGPACSLWGAQGGAVPTHGALAATKGLAKSLRCEGDCIVSTYIGRGQGADVVRGDVDAVWSPARD
jgi:hypothetical protein